MWYPSTVSVAPSVEPVTLAHAKDQCGILTAEMHFDGQIGRLIKAARAHAEKYCNACWAEQTIVSQCDGFADLVRLPHGPLKTVTSIAYIDTDGVTATVADTVYETHKDGLEPSIGLKHGLSWPNIRPNSRITLTAIYGDAVPDEVHLAMMMFIAESFLGRENAKREDWTALDAMLCNHRRGV